MLEEIKQVIEGTIRGYLGQMFGEESCGASRVCRAMDEKLDREITGTVVQFLCNAISKIDCRSQVDWGKIVMDGLAQLDPRKLEIKTRQLLQRRLDTDAYVPMLLNQDCLSKRITTAKLGETKLRIGFVGRTKAGKSSLINKIVGRLKAKVGYISSQTDSVTPIHVDEWENTVFLDTPGYCDEQRGWSLDRLLEIYKKQFDVIVIVVSDGLDSQSKQVFSEMKRLGKVCLIVQNKSDFLCDVESDYSSSSTQFQLDEMRKEMAREIGCDAEIFFTYCISTKSGQFRDCISQAENYESVMASKYKILRDDIEKLKTRLKELSIERNRIFAENTVRDQLFENVREILERLRYSLHKDIEEMLGEQFTNQFTSISGSQSGVLDELRKRVLSSEFPEEQYQNFIKDVLVKWPSVSTELGELILSGIITYLYSSLLNSFSEYAQQPMKCSNDKNCEMQPLIAEQRNKDILIGAGMIIEILNTVYLYKNNYLRSRFEAAYDRFFDVCLLEALKELATAKFKLPAERKKVAEHVVQIIRESDDCTTQTGVLEFAKMCDCEHEMRCVSRIVELMKSIQNGICKRETIIENLKIEDLVILNVYVNVAIEAIDEEFFVQLGNLDNIKILENVVSKLDVLNTAVSSLDTGRADESGFRTGLIRKFKRFRCFSGLKLPKVSVPEKQGESVSITASEYKKGGRFSAYKMDQNVVGRFILNIIKKNAKIRDFCRMSLNAYLSAKNIDAAFEAKEREIVTLIKGVNADITASMRDFKSFTRELFVKRARRVIYEEPRVGAALKAAMFSELTRAMETLNACGNRVEKFRTINIYLLEGLVERFRRQIATMPIQTVLKNEIFKTDEACGQFAELVRSMEDTEDTLQCLKEILIELKAKGVIIFGGCLYVSAMVHERFDLTEPKHVNNLVLLGEVGDLYVLEKEEAEEIFKLRGATYSQMVARTREKGLAFNKDKCIIMTDVYSAIQICAISYDQKYNMSKIVKRRLNQYLWTVFDLDNVLLIGSAAEAVCKDGQTTSKIRMIMPSDHSSQGIRVLIERELYGQFEAQIMARARTDDNVFEDTKRYHSDDIVSMRELVSASAKYQEAEKPVMHEVDRTRDDSATLTLI